MIKKKTRRKNTQHPVSKYYGVSCSFTDLKPWRAYIQWENIGYHLGHYKSEIAAAQAYDAAVDILHCKYKRRNWYFNLSPEPPKYIVDFIRKKIKKTGHPVRRMVFNYQIRGVTPKWLKDKCLRGNKQLDIRLFYDPLC